LSEASGRGRILPLDAVSRKKWTAPAVELPDLTILN
jgi:hypothetical protein